MIDREEMTKDIAMIIKELPDTTPEEIARRIVNFIIAFGGKV